MDLSSFDLPGLVPDSRDRASGIARPSQPENTSQLTVKKTHSVPCLIKTALALSEKMSIIALPSQNIPRTTPLFGSAAVQANPEKGITQEAFHLEPSQLVRCQQTTGQGQP
jgi:hypothetical protein